MKRVEQSNKKANFQIQFTNYLEALTSKRKPFENFANKPNPFVNEESAEIFSKVITKVYGFALHCALLEGYLGNKEDLKRELRSLKSQIQEIRTDLKHIIPKEATKKKEVSHLRYLREQPLQLHISVNVIIKELEKYLDPYYSRDKRFKKEEDIKRFWEQTYKKPYPRRIYMDSRTKTTIAISIEAYKLGCNFRKLYDVYNKTPKEIRSLATDIIARHLLLFR